MNSRVKLSSSSLKGPLQQAHAAAGQQAEALVKVADQQAGLTKQVEGLQELIGALQAVQAKQFKVGCWGLLDEDTHLTMPRVRYVCHMLVEGGIMV